MHRSITIISDCRNELEPSLHEHCYGTLDPAIDKFILVSSPQYFIKCIECITEKSITRASNSSVLFRRSSRRSPRLIIFSTLFNITCFTSSICSSTADILSALPELNSSYNIKRLPQKCLPCFQNPS